MMQVFVNALVVLASGYMVYDILRKFKETGYVPYFRTVITGLILLCLAYTLIYVFHPWITDFFSLIGQLREDLFMMLGKEAPDKQAGPYELAPYLLFLAVLVFWIAHKGYYRFRLPKDRLQGTVRWKDKIALKSYEKKGFGRFVYEKTTGDEGFVITLIDGNVIFGELLKIFIDEQGQWIRVLWYATGSRNERGMIEVGRRNNALTELEYQEDSEDFEKRLESHFIYVPMGKIMVMQAVSYDELSKMIVSISQDQDEQE